LSKIACECDGFAPVTGAFSDATFAVGDDDEFQLRLA
jgi:hypothetical protein